MTTLEQQKSALLSNLLESISIDNVDLQYFITNSDATDVCALSEYIEEQGGFNVEIIYHSSAMEFLSQHDQSLSESLELARDYGYTIHDIDSELLASLLASEYARNDFDSASAEISNYYIALAELEGQEVTDSIKRV